MDQPKNRLLGTILRRGIKRRPGVVSVLDPGTEYVKALVVQIDGDRAAIVGQGVQRHDESPFERGSHAIDLRLQKACEAALRQAEDMSASEQSQSIVPYDLVLAFPSQWVRQGAFTVQQRRTMPAAKITENEIEALFARAQRLAIQQLAGELGTSRRSLTLIGCDVIEIDVGGHPVTDPVGFWGENLSLTVFNALVQNEHLAVMERLAEHLELDLLELVSEEHTLADCLPMEEAVVVSAGSRLTSLAWVRAGCPLRATTFAFGGLKLTERLSSAFGLPEAKAEALKLHYSFDELDPADAQLVRDVLAPGIAEWLARIEAGIATLAGKAVLPPYIYFSGGGSGLRDLLDAAHSFAWLQHLNFARYPEVHAFGPDEVGGVFNRTGCEGGCEMATAMALARRLVPRKRTGEQMRAMLDRITRKHIGVYSGG